MNDYRLIILFVEGPDDSRLARSVLLPRVLATYSDARVYEYSQKLKSDVLSYLRTIQRVGSWDYLFLADIDGATCASSKKEQLISVFPLLEEERVIVVKSEIEGWYLAGLDSDTCRQLGVPAHQETSEITKERFDLEIPRRFDSRTDFMQEVLKQFDLGVARRKNESFRYAMRKHFQGR